MNERKIRKIQDTKFEILEVGGINQESDTYKTLHIGIGQVGHSLKDWKRRYILSVTHDISGGCWTSHFNVIPEDKLKKVSYLELMLTSNEASETCVLFIWSSSKTSLTTRL